MYYAVHVTNAELKHREHIWKWWGCPLWLYAQHEADAFAHWFRELSTEHTTKL